MSEQPDLSMLLSNIQDLPEKLRAEALEIIRVNAELIVGYAQIFCPVKTGNLRDSIEARATPDGAVVTAGNAKVSYAIKVEMRTPYMGPALQLVLPQLIEQLTAKLQEIVTNEST